MLRMESVKIRWGEVILGCCSDRFEALMSSLHFVVGGRGMIAARVSLR